jgi:hypothetical protein
LDKDIWLATPYIVMFGKAKCKLCGDEVRFALRHLHQKHSEIFEGEVRKMKMPQIMKKYFDE